MTFIRLKSDFIGKCRQSAKKYANQFEYFSAHDSSKKSGLFASKNTIQTEYREEILLALVSSNINVDWQTVDARKYQSTKSTYTNKSNHYSDTIATFITEPLMHIDESGHDLDEIVRNLNTILEVDYFSTYPESVGSHNSIIIAHVPIFDKDLLAYKLNANKDTLSKIHINRSNAHADAEMQIDAT